MGKRRPPSAPHRPGLPPPRRWQRPRVGAGRRGKGGRRLGGIHASMGGGGRGAKAGGRPPGSRQEESGGVLPLSPTPPPFSPRAQLRKSVVPPTLMGLSKHKKIAGSIVFFGCPGKGTKKQRRCELRCGTDERRAKKKWNTRENHEEPVAGEKKLTESEGNKLERWRKGNTSAKYVSR